MDLTNFHRGVGRGAAWHLALLLLAAGALPAMAQLAPVVVSPPFRVGEPGVECWSATVRAVGPDSIEVSAMTGAGLVRGRLAWPGAWFDGGVLAPAGRAIGGASPVANPPGLLAFADERALGLAAVRVGQWRTVVVSPDRGCEGAGAFNDGLPVVVYTDDGSDWKPDPGVGLVTQLPLGSAALAAPVRDAPGEGNNAGVRGDTPRGVDRQRHAPSVAVRRIDGDSDEVYVAFVARSARDEANTDICISRSIDAQTSAIAFPVMAAGFLKVSDALLATATGTDGADQFVPAIAIDSCGGVNLMFYDNRHDPDRTDSVELVDVYYARIANYGTGNETVTQHRLTPQSIRVDNLGGSRFLGDYHNLTVSADGKTIYAAYIARDNADPVAGDRTCYVHRINVVCSDGPLAEMTGDGAVTEADAAAFASAWAAGAPEADTDLDMAVDANDLVNYLITYSEESE